MIYFGMIESRREKAFKKDDYIYTKYDGRIIKRNSDEFDRFLDNQRMFVKNFSVVFVDSFEDL